MPKPNKIKNYKESKKLVKYGYNWSKSGRALLEMLPEGQTNTDSLANKMEKINYSVGREDLGTFVALCLMGEVNGDGSPKYKLEDIIYPGEMVEEKKAFYVKLENLLTPPEMNANKDQQEDYKARIKAADTLFLRGAKRCFETMHTKVIEAVSKNDISEFYTPELETLGSFGLVATTNYVQNCYVNNQLKADSIIARYDHKEKDEPSLAETVLGNETYQDMAKKYGGMINMVKDIIRPIQSINEYIEGMKDIDLNGLYGYVSLDRTHKRLKANPNISIEELFPNESIEQLNAKYNEGNPIDEDKIGDFDYATAIVDDAMRFNVVNTRGENVRYTLDDIASMDNLQEHMPSIINSNPDSKAILSAIKIIKENNDDPMYRYGIGMLMVKGTNFRDIKYSGKLVFDQDEAEAYDDENSYYHDIKFDFKNTFERENVLKEAYLAEVDLGDYYDLDSDISHIEDFNAFMREKLEDYKKAKVEPSKGLVQFQKELEELSASINKVGNETTIKAHQEVRKLTASIFKKIDETIKSNAEAFEAEDESIIPIMDSIIKRFNQEKFPIENIMRKSAMRAGLAENGARLGTLSDNDNEQKMIEIAADRVNQLTEFKNKLKELQPFGGGSKDWKNLCSLVEHAEKVGELFMADALVLNNSKDPEDIRKYEKSLEELSNAMNLVRFAATRYVKHKVEQKGFDKGKDLERLQTAKRLESFGKQQCDYVMSKVRNNMLKVHNENGYLSADSVKEDLNKVLEFKNAMKAAHGGFSSSKEYDAMMKSVEGLLKVQSALSQTKDNRFTIDDEKKYFGYTDNRGYHKGEIDKVLEKVKDYTGHKLLEGDFSDKHLKRLEAATTLKDYLTHLRNGANRTKAERCEELIVGKPIHDLLDNADKSMNELTIQYYRANKEAFTKVFDENKKMLSNIASQFERKNNKVPAEVKVPQDKVSGVKEAMYKMIAYQKFIVAYDKVDKKRDDTTDDHEIVGLVNIGKFNDLVDLVKKDVAVRHFVEKYGDSGQAVDKMTREKGLPDAVKQIEAAAKEKAEIYAKEAKEAEEAKAAEVPKNPEVGRALK